MKDAKGKELTPGQRVKRIVDGKAVDAGYEYDIVIIDDQLAAHGGFLIEYLDVERAKEFEVIK